MSRQITVNSGGSLWRIVKKEYGINDPAAINAKIQEIKKNNKIKNSNNIFEGQKLELSDLTASQPQKLPLDNKVPSSQTAVPQRKPELPVITNNTNPPPAASTLQPLFETQKGKAPKVLLDPGHGGKDSGALAGGIKESDYNLDIANRTAEILKKNGIDVSMTDRNANKYGRQSARDAANPDAFISIHANSGNSSAKGIDTFYGNSSPNSKNLADSLQSELIKNTGAKNRGSSYNDYVVIRDDKANDGINVPSALVETGFLTNNAEKSSMISEEGKNKRAQAIASGIVNFLGLNKQSPTT